MLVDYERSTQGTAAVLGKNDSSKLPASQIGKIRLILTALDVAKKIGDMNFTGSGLHLLKGDYAGFWSVKVNTNYRIIFRFKDEIAFDVDFLDYH